MARAVFLLCAMLAAPSAGLAPSTGFLGRSALPRHRPSHRRRGGEVQRSMTTSYLDNLSPKKVRL